MIFARWSRSGGNDKAAGIWLPRGFVVYLMSDNTIERCAINSNNIVLFYNRFEIIT